MAEWADGTGQILTGVHLRGQCVGDWCVIHRPMPGPWEDWTTWWCESEKIMYRICPHGIRHPAAEEVARMWQIGVWHVGNQHCCAKCRCAPTLQGDGVIDSEVVYHVIES
jgi:hypothetical protein